MSSAWGTALVAGALCGVVVFGDAEAQAAAPSSAAARMGKAAKTAAKQPPKPLPTIKVIVTNSRPASLLELEASVGGGVKMKKVLGTLKPGKQAVAIMPRGDNCQVDLHGAFDDGQTIDSASVDICADRTFNLTD